MKRSVFFLEVVLISAFSGFVMLPVLHELGHYFAGVSTGSEINDIKLLPPKPHVSFRFTSSHAIPWVNAGGIAFPSIVATCFGIAWLVTRKRVNAHVRLLLWLPSIVLFSGNLGLFIEITKKKDINYHHLLYLGEYFGLHDGALILFQIVPAIISLAIIIFLIYTAKKKGGTQQNI